MIYQYPLFRSDPDSLEEAAKYLAADMLNSGVVKVMEIDKDFYHKEFNKEGRNETFDFLRQMIADTCYFMYGKNLAQMANYLVVSKIVKEKLMDSLINYMQAVNLDFELIYFCPSEFITTIMQSKTKDPNFKPFERWNPANIWDFEDTKNLSPDEALMSPINGFTHMTLYLKNIDNKAFLISLQKNGILSREDIIKNNWRFEVLELKLLPYNTFNKVLNIANAIFKYY